MNVSRQVVVVTGRTGAGKSVWAKQFSSGWPRRIIFDPFTSYSAQRASVGQLLDLHTSARSPDSEFAVQFSSPEMLPVAADVAYSLGDCLFVVEELAVVLDGGRATPEWLRRLIFLGRHRDVSLLLVAQRAASIPADVRSQASRFVTFAQSEFVDRDWLRKSFGPGVSDRVSVLRNLSCVDIDLAACREYEYRLDVSGVDN